MDFEWTAIYLCNGHTHLLTNDPGQQGECVNVKDERKTKRGTRERPKPLLSMATNMIITRQ